MILTRKEGAGEAESEKEKCGWTRGWSGGGEEDDG